MTHSPFPASKTEERLVPLGDRPARLLVVKNPNGLLDGDIPGGRLPYWAELWPSALALSEHLLQMPFRGERVLELGCGMGLTTLAIARAGGRPLAIDYDPDALRFAKENLSRDGGRGDFCRMDWGALALGAAFPYIVAADILYERGELPKIGALLKQYLARGGVCVVAEPGREVGRLFFQNLTRYGLMVARTIPTAVERVTIRHLSRR
jgi:ETFB lysine methyltransferase